MKEIITMKSYYIKYLLQSENKAFEENDNELENTVLETKFYWPKSGERTK